MKKLIKPFMKNHKNCIKVDGTVEMGEISGFEIKNVVNSKYKGLGLFLHIRTSFNDTELVCIWKLNNDFSNKINYIPTSEIGFAIKPPCVGNIFNRVLNFFNITNIGDLVCRSITVKRNSRGIAILKDVDKESKLQAEWLMPDLFSFGDIRELIVTERINDLIQLFPKSSDDLLRIKDGLSWEI